MGFLIIFSQSYQSYHFEDHAKLFYTNVDKLFDNFQYLQSN